MAVTAPRGRGLPHCLSAAINKELAPSEFEFGASEFALFALQKRPPTPRIQLGESQHEPKAGMESMTRVHTPVGISLGEGDPGSKISFSYSYFIVPTFVSPTTD